MDTHKEGYLLAAQLEEPYGIAGLDENGLIYKNRLPPTDFSQITLSSLNGETKGIAAQLVNDEAVIRKQEDIKLQQQINFELSIREKEDIKLQQQINQEATIRHQEDVKLQQQISIINSIKPIVPVWQNLTLSLGWASNPLAQFVMINNLVLVTGILTKPTKAIIDEVVAILPIGFRPRQTQKFLSQGLSVTSRPCFEVFPTGEIRYQNIGAVPLVTNGLTLSSIIFVPGN